MLVLTRKVQEQIRIGDNITITVLRLQGNVVRVGIEAPRQIRVVRGELPAKPDGQTLPVSESSGDGPEAGESDEPCEPSARISAERVWHGTLPRGRKMAAVVRAVLTDLETSNRTVS